MKVYSLETAQILNCTIQEAWAFFSSPENLDLLTPVDMKFEILTQSPIPKIYEGQIIEYNVRPLLNIPMYWKTEITKVIPEKCFIDNQLHGPYKLWRHQHIFETHASGVLMKDKLEYALPLGLLGRLAHSLFVKRKLEHIFNFRFKKVESIFNQKT
jgi:ligand-binding SRPBCC domain-containing protein